MLVADAVFECILDEGDEHQRRDKLVWSFRGQVHRDFYLVGIAQSHQRDVVADEVELAVERNTVLVALVEHKAHHLRQFQYRVLGFLWVYVHQRMDVVQRVHEEVRVDLVLQIFQLLLQVLLLQGDELLLVATGLEVELDTEIHAEHQHQDDESDDFVLTKHAGMSLSHGLPVGTFALGMVLNGLLVGAHAWCVFLDGRWLVDKEILLRRTVVHSFVRHHLLVLGHVARPFPHVVRPALALVEHEGPQHAGNQR